MKILVAIDSSQASQHVVATAATRPWPSGTVFCVMSIVDMGRWEGLPAMVDDAHHEAHALVTGAIAKLAQGGYEAFSEVQAGFPKKAIPEYAKKWGADFVIVGSHGQSALTRFFLGSVAQTVLRTAPCSVEIVRHGSAFPLPSHGIKILLATEGSDCSVKAVDSIAHRPWPATSKVRIVSVVQLFTPETQSTASPLCAPYPSGLLEQMWNDAHTHAGVAMADARKTLSSTSLKVCTHSAMPVGEPRAYILDEAEAWGADLIVLGSHGRHGLDRMLLGSVSESVAMYANCSVEIVR